MIKLKEFKVGQRKITVYYGLRIHGNWPYFSVTGMEMTLRGRELSGGCIHDLIQGVTREFDDLIALHLSDADGVPMHPIANGHFFLTETREYPNHHFHYADSVVANHFRISVEDVPAMRAFTKAQLEAFVDAQRPRWKKEADDAVAAHGLGDQ